MAKIEALEIPKDVIDSDWKDDIEDFEEYPNEIGYDSSKNIPEDAELINKKEVKGATAKQAKRQKIGHIALFSPSDDRRRLAA